jgi:hypothetical protein
MAKRRRRKRGLRIRFKRKFPFVQLGSSAAEHDERAGKYTSLAIRAANAARINAEKQACREALADLLEANRYQGAAGQEYFGAKEGGRRSRPSAEFMNSTTRAHSEFIRFCVR